MSNNHRHRLLKMYHFVIVLARQHYKWYLVSITSLAFILTRPNRGNFTYPHPPRFEDKDGYGMNHEETSQIHPPPIVQAVVTVL